MDGMPWTRDNAAVWSRWRLPTTVLTLGPLVVASLFLALIWNDESSDPIFTVAEVVDPWSFVCSMAMGFGAATMTMTWYAPRLCAYALSVPIATLAFDDTNPGLIVLGLGWAALIVFDIISIYRQRALTSPEEPLLHAPAALRIERSDRLRVAGAACAVVVTLTGAVVFWSWRGDLIAFSERAVSVDGVITERDLGMDTVQVEADGHSYEFWMWDASVYPVGSHHAVLVDPDDRSSALNWEDPDEDGVAFFSGLASGAAAFAFIPLLLHSWRRRRIESRAASSEPWRTARFRSSSDSDGMNVYAVDDAAGARAIAYLPRLEPLLPIDSDPALTDDDPEPPMDESGLMTGAIQGLRSDGSLCVIRIDGADGRWGSVRPSRDAHTLLAMIARVARRMTGSRRETLDETGPVVPTAIEPHAPHSDSPGVAAQLHRLVRITAIPGVMVIGALGFVLVPWFTEGEDAISVVPLAPAVGVLAGRWWRRSVRPWRAAPGGLRVTGDFLDRVIACSDIGEIEETDDYVSFVVKGGRELGYAPARSLTATERRREIAAAAEELREAANQAPGITPTPSGRPGYRPSSSLLVALSVAAAWLVAGLL